MPPEPDVEEEDYVSSEDSDFAPEGAPASESSPSDNEDAAQEQPAAGARRRRADDAGFENSGDEAVIGKGKKRRRKDKSKPREGDGGDGDGDGDGDGGLIQTRSMRAREKVERRLAGPSGPVTIDVDAVWADLTGAATTTITATRRSSPTAGAGGSPDKPTTQATETGDDTTRPQPAKHAAAAAAAAVVGGETDPPDMIRIKRTYNFAGKVHTEEKLVPRESAEAKLHLATVGADAGPDPAARRPPPRRAFRSAFEPVAADQQQQQQRRRRADLDLGVGVRLRARGARGDGAEEARRLNTIEKSRLDWAGFVDKEGIKDELELAGRSKRSFAARQDFLARSEARREEEARRARLAGRA